jgi:hypothetical protein
MKTTEWEAVVKDNYEEIANYNCLGLRLLRKDEHYKISDYARNSKDWDFENDVSSDQELPGTSALMIYNGDLSGPDDLIQRIKDVLPKSCKYGDGNVVLLGGYYSHWGDDDEEIVIADACVLAYVH